MADKSFGVKELNLLNASGTPTVTSPNNLNLNANTVAISTSCTIGNNLTVTSTTNSANLNVTGIGTLTRAFATDLSVSGVTTITVPANANPHSSWDVVNNSASSYRFTGPGQDGAEDNPNIYLVRGQRYVFKMNASGHPFQIRVSNGGSAYSDGVTNNGSQTGNVVFNVQHDAPAQLYYQCTSHGSMVGNIYIVGGPQVISGVVTTTSGLNILDGRVKIGTTSNTPASANEPGIVFGDNTAGTATKGIASFCANGAAPLLLTRRVSDGNVLGIADDTTTRGMLRVNSNDLEITAIEELRLSTGAGHNEKIRLTNAGRFGINVTGPDAMLHVKGSDNVLGVFESTDADSLIQFKDNSTSDTILMGALGGDDLLLRCDAGNIVFHVANNNERFRIGSSGQIGISGANYGTSGQVLMSQGSGSVVQWASPAYIIHDVWALSSSMTTSSTETKVTTWSRANAYSATIGSAMSESSGIFTFPETGIYKVVFDVYYQTANSSRFISHRIYKVISATSTRIAQKLTSVNTAGSQWYQSDKVEAYFDVTNVSTHKIEFTVATENATTLGSGHSSSLIQTGAYFTKIGDT